MDHLINALQQYMGVWQLSQLGVIRKVINTWHWSGLVDQDGQYRVLPPFSDDSDLHHTQWIDDALHTDKFIQLSDDHSQLLYRSPLEKNCWLWFQAQDKFSDAEQWIEQHSTSVNLLASSLLELGVQTAQSNFVQSIVDNSPSLISIRDRTGQFLLVNSAFTQWVNQDFSIIGKTLFQVFPAEVAARLHNQDKKVFEGGRAFEYDEALISQNGEERTFLTLKFPVTQGLQRTAVCTIATDISDRIEYEERLKESESSLRIMIENIPNAIVIFDATEQRFEEANRAAEILFGLSRLQLCKMGPVQVSPEFQPDGTLSSESAKTQIGSAVQGETVVFEWYHQHISTRQIPCEIRLVRLPKARGIRIMAIITDISERKATEQALRSEQDRLNYLAHHDTLTQLPNRLLLMDRLEQATKRCKREKNQLAVLMLDLDGFKEINDTLGHNYGDLVLKEVSERLLKLLRASDTAARLGGDEFVILIENIQGQDEAILVANKLLSTLSDPMTLERHTVNISASIGIALYPSPNNTEPYLLDHADMAMYQAKKAGKNRFHIYDQH